MLNFAGARNTCRLLGLLVLSAAGLIFPRDAAAQTTTFPKIVADEIFTKAATLLGVPYDFGGKSPEGADCSGFVWIVYRELFHDMPRSTYALAKFGTPAAVDDLRPGDLLLFATGENRKILTHVAIYLGQNTLIHSVSDGYPTGVVLSDLSDPYWRTRLVLARRPNFDGKKFLWEIPGKDYNAPTTHGWYRGPLVEGRPEGRGVFFFRNGDTFIGQFQKGKPNGPGVYHWKNGAWYSGQFLQGERDGLGDLKLPNKNVIRARWSQDEPVKILAGSDKKEPEEQLKALLVGTINAFLSPPADTEAQIPRSPPS